MPSRLHTADHIVIVGYFVLLTLIGFYFWKRMRHVRDLFAGRQRFRGGSPASRST